MLKDAAKIIELYTSGMPVDDICKETDSSAWYCEKVLRAAGSMLQLLVMFDRLRSLMGDSGGGPVDVRVRIKERDLVGIGRKSSRYRNRM